MLFEEVKLPSPAKSSRKEKASQWLLRAKIKKITKKFAINRQVSYCCSILTETL
jgi:hypothetical protein